MQARGREAVRNSRILPILLSVLRGGSLAAQAGAAGALANLSCEPQSVRLIRRSDGIPPLIQLLGCGPLLQAFVDTLPKLCWIRYDANLA